MDIPFIAQGLLINDTTHNKVSQSKLNSTEYGLDHQRSICFMTGLVMMLVLFLCLGSTAFAAGSMQGAFINVGDKQAANRAFVKDVSERVLLPSFEAFSMQSRHLSQTANTFCNAGRTTEQFAQLKNSWRTTQQAWAQTLPFRFGPVLENFLDLKIQFWSDDKNLVRSQAQRFLRANSSPTAEQLAKAASPAQGLPAIEYLLFDSEEGGFATFTDGGSANQRCDYLKAAAQNVSNKSRDLLNAWGNSSRGYLAEFTYSSNPEVINESFAVILREALVAVEVVKNLKVAKPSGLHLPNAKVNAFFLESWRSQRSQENMISSLITFQQIYYGGSHFGLDDLLISNYNEPDVEFRLRTQISKCLELASALPKPLFSEIKKSKTQGQMEELHRELIKLIAMIKQSLSQTLGITIGFSSNDGD
ncbi:imelysin family protein [Methyloprofundus sp.]|uniref:imelysin family protein n=1 Tax=Methyloprofundus sp. TaxID=2020875 RepID=UPI003D0FC955